LGEPTKLHTQRGKPANPAIDQDFVVFAYGNGGALVQSFIDQPTIHVQGIEAMLDLQEHV
jgi:hypothetical protein